MGDESGGGGGGAPKGASVRGQVGLTKAEQNRRATAQEPMRGGARAAAAKNASAISDAEIDRQEAGDFSGGDKITTSTEGAYRDLNTRATDGQISQRVMNVLPGTSILNEMGKKVATSIQDQIAAGGTPVYDTIGRIQGVVSKNALGFDVYTGGGVDPIANPGGTRLQKGIGYVQNERAAFGNYGPVGLGMKAGGGSGTIGGDNGDGGATVGTTQTAATATNVTGSTTSLSSAARRLAAGGAAGGATTRRFLG